MKDWLFVEMHVLSTTLSSPQTQHHEQRANKGGCKKKQMSPSFPKAWMFRAE
jgi:hypothetical protein